jgi:hypothetical protein
MACRCTWSYDRSIRCATSRRAARVAPLEHRRARELGQRNDSDPALAACSRSRSPTPNRVLRVSARGPIESSDSDTCLRCDSDASQVRGGAPGASPWCSAPLAHRPGHRVRRVRVRRVAAAATAATLLAFRSSLSP